MVEYGSSFKENIEIFYNKFLSLKMSFLKKISETKNKQLFVQVLFNRIIFLYFLEKSQLLNNNKSYLRNLYQDAILNNKNFYNEYLQMLFFNVLNVEHDIKKAIKIGDINFGTVPYLNGNLFTKQEHSNNNLPNDIWESLFDFLDSYDWSLTEEGLDHFVINPRVLGFVYEKNVIAETGKDNVSYFTPDEISINITQNTIAPFILDKIENKFGVKYKKLEDEIISEIGDRETVDYVYSVILKNIRIVDNACGSGAFLITAENYLYNLNLQCIKILGVKESNVDLKKRIITNNIFGVDIQNDAVEIAKLRLWLSLLSEEVKEHNVTPLPNIEYNILSGNSLVGLVKISNSEQMELFSKEGDFDSESTNTQIVKKNRLLRQYKLESHTTDKLKIKKQIEEINEYLREKLNRKLLLELKKQKLNFNITTIKNINPFHWVIEFSEIFDPTLEEKSKGFDIVIGNPPYGNILSNFEKIYLGNTLFSVSGKDASNNAASVFIESSYIIMNKMGRFGMIVPNTIARKDQFGKIRNFLLDQTNLYQIIDEGNPFKDSKVSLEMISLFFCKSQNKKKYDIKIISRRQDCPVESHLNSEIFQKHGWFVLYYDRLMSDINEKSSNIGEYGSFSSAGRPSAFNLKIDTKGDTKIAKGMNIKSYYIDTDLYIDTNKDVKEYIKSLKYPLLILPEVSNKVKAAICDNHILPISGVMIWAPKSQFKNIQDYLLLYLNSSLPSYYFNKYIINKSKLTTHLDSTYLERLPIIIPKNIDMYIKLSKIMTFLSNQNPLDDYKNYLQKEVIDPLIINMLFDISPEIESHIQPLFNSDNLSLKAIQLLIQKIQDNQQYDEALKKIKSNPSYIQIQSYFE